jgi:hypothetical protein
MFQPLIDAVFLLAYAGIFTAVLPYILGAGENHGVLIPGALGLSVSAVVWSVLNWVGLSDTDGYLWVIAMVIMPIGGVVLTRIYAAARAKGKLQFVDSVAGKSNSNDDIVLLSA